METFEPFTLSCTMRVLVLEGEFWARDVVLKMHDPRFATDLRRRTDLEPWSQEQADAYVDYVRSGGAAKLVETFKTMEERELSTVEQETYQHEALRLTCADEMEVYNVLKPFQGKETPMFLTSVKLITPSTLPSRYLSREARKFFDVHGLLMEYIPGISLGDLPHSNIPRTSWQTIVDQAIDNTGILSFRSILNEDVHRRNVLITPDSSRRCGYRAVMIDFGSCRFRGEDEDESEWACAKHEQNEEGGLARNMKFRLANFGFELVYNPSARVLHFAELAKKANDEKQQTAAEEHVNTVIGTSL